MEPLMEYVKPELLVVSVVLFFIGNWLKKAEFLEDKYIPLVLGGIGILLSMIWVLAKCSFCGAQDMAMGIFTAIVQGVLVAGLSTYVEVMLEYTGKRKSHED